VRDRLILQREAGSRVSNDVQAILDASTEALRTGRAADAIAMLESLLRDYHDCAEAHVILGDAYARERRTEEANDSYTLAGCFKPQWSLPWVRRGMLAFAEHRHADAIADLSEALARGSIDAGVHNTLGAAYFELRRFEDARLQFERALAIKPDYADAHSNLGCLLFRELEQLEAGEQHVQAALRLEPDNAVAQCNQVMLLQARGRAAEALALSEKLLARL
jgi:tetratricopeptide (TPR) repeat protein